MVRFVAQRVAEHLADARELVLAVEREDHAEQAVELGAFHALPEGEHVFGEELLIVRIGEIEVAAQPFGDAGDELILLHDGLNVFEHRLALVRVDTEGGDHVEKRIGVDVLFMSVATEHELKLRRGDELTDHVLDVVTHNAFGGGKVSDAHTDDPTFLVGHNAVVAPLLDVLTHGYVFWLPVIGLHRAVELIGPLILQGEQIEGHRVATINHFFSGKRGLRFVLIEDEGFGADLKGFLHDGKTWKLKD